MTKSYFLFFIIDIVTFQSQNGIIDCWFGFRVTPRHEEIARSAVIAHRDVARLAERPDAPCVVDQAILLASALDIPSTTATQKLTSLLARHQAEWSRFLAEETCDGSWVRALCE